MTGLQVTLDLHHLRYTYRPRDKVLLRLMEGEQEEEKQEVVQPLLQQEVGAGPQPEQLLPKRNENCFPQLARLDLLAPTKVLTLIVLLAK